MADGKGLSAAALILAAGKSGGSGEPEAYIKSASIDGGTLTLTNKDDTTVDFTAIHIGSSEPTDENVNVWIDSDGVPDEIYTAGYGISITNRVISVSIPQASGGEF